MGQDRTGYRYGAILIEAARILTPQFNPTTISLSGAQVELLRNLTMLLHSERTFVDEYHDTYYLTATVADFDAISAIVADLEEILMSNPNTVFGYSDRWSEDLSETKAGDGTYQGTTIVVPVGYVYVVNFMYYRNNTGARGNVSMRFHDGTTYYYAAFNTSPEQLVPTKWEGAVKLAAGDSVLITQNSCVHNDVIQAGVWGYKMKVPG